MYKKCLLIGLEKVYICRMNGLHKGEILRSAAVNSGLTFKEIARRMRISRSTLYNTFNTVNVRDEFLFKFFRAIGGNITDHFPYLKIEQMYHQVQDSYTPYKKANQNHESIIEKLENYNTLLKIVIKLVLSKEDELPAVKKEARIFLEKLKI